ncbi:protein spinster isoform X2 [Athalia rosae]|uniref:protein spinster isoform X2 n=1 Tax=Athalia rosae TaxID=37344 RepID=UPI002034219A|nr:protein spinster isoform X2 [Athalia rosae]XP_048508509.1 protein spinster isoform X2 [Athalia rosae]XP_048508510.1 protein spinster isoform X2 [Athalia rosae]
METTRLPSNLSHQHLMAGEENETPLAVPTKRNSPVQRVITVREWLTVIVLCYVNLINYMDRFTIAGILTDIKDEFKIGNDDGGLLQTVFIISYMIFAPLFGYLGDRYNRKLIMSFGVFLWCLTTFIGSYMRTFGWFLVFRTFVGIGEASYSTIAPTIISDLFVKDVRSKMLALFYFAIPVGSGLGYITGSETARIAGSWHWGLRVTPVLGVLAVFLLLVVVQDPVRGEREGGGHIHSTSWSDDIKSLCKNPSFMLSTAGFTCVSFVAGALAWWGPTFIHLGFQLQPNGENTTLNDVSYKFGLIAMVAGVIGVPLGSYLAQRLRVACPQADPLICAVGLILSAPLLFFAAIAASKNSVVCYVLIFFGQLALNLNWSIVADMLLYVVIPTRRSTAEAFQILVAHALGDAGSPYIVGVISEALKAALSPDTNIHEPLPSQNSTIDDPLTTFRSLQYSLFLTTFIEVIGGLFFFITALYIQRDKAIVDLSIAEKNLDTKNNGQAESTRL